jgi:hypothetical protein
MLRKSHQKVKPIKRSSKKTPKRSSKRSSKKSSKKTPKRSSKKTPKRSSKKTPKRSIVSHFAAQVSPRGSPRESESKCAKCKTVFSGKHQDGTNPGDSCNDYSLCQDEDCKKSVSLICARCEKAGRQYKKYCHKCVQEKKDPRGDIMCPCGGMAKTYDIRPIWNEMLQNTKADYNTLRTGKPLKK